MITLEALNTIPVDEFTSVLGPIFEHSPWVAQRAATARPFSSRLELLDAMRAVVQAARLEEQLDLIRAHPQLGARGRKRLELTEASAHEQRRAGLDACTDEEFAQLLLLNTAYVKKFAFPFILAVRGHDPDSILAAMASRLNNDVEVERHTALTQIGLIGGYRLADLVASPAGAEVNAMRNRLVSSATALNALAAVAAAAGPAVTVTGAIAAVSDPVATAPITTATAATAATAAATTTATASVATTASAALLREWMFAANLEVYPGAAGNLAGVQRSDPNVPCLLIGLYSDSTTEVLRRDGGLGSLLGIAVAQQIRQKRLPTHFGLLVLASPTDERHGSIFLDAHPGAIRNAPVLTVTETDPSSSPLRAAGITRCIVLVHQGPATDAPHPALDARTLERAAQSLEDFLTRPRKIQE
jgi:2-oxo-4-hydroxy-4-carboxy-5-ureidoimidazoline decarboxylase